ncbi:MAG: hypothetical protein SFH39_12035 [Candidatus Magnetobacterium sp. LHC-1]|nr:hypothetical protein [Candidatus Magnetobacterium casensis]
MTTMVHLDNRNVAAIDLKSSNYGALISAMVAVDLKKLSMVQ